jgi:hypothetical protein
VDLQLEIDDTFCPEDKSLLRKLKEVGVRRDGYLDGDGGGRLYSERDGPLGGFRDSPTGHSDPRGGTSGLRPAMG